jgi:hypothetical protein
MDRTRRKIDRFQEAVSQRRKWKNDFAVISATFPQAGDLAHTVICCCRIESPTRVD